MSIPSRCRRSSRGGTSSRRQNLDAREIRRDQKDRYCATIEFLGDLFEPRVAHADLPIIPHREGAQLLQHPNVRKQLILPAFVPVAVADENEGVLGHG